jgi:hypothetical protein
MLGFRTGDAQRLRLAAGGEIEFLSDRAVAKFIDKSSLFIPLTSSVPSTDNYSPIMLQMLMFLLSRPTCCKPSKHQFGRSINTFQKN